ncbi:MFS transporter [Novosphingobium aquae]|uniref:MFS transporter n=1 Tax=Novosphingobium aquae TaxID=3133435 RepID=A0ABU8SBN9_9SPHN
MIPQGLESEISQAGNIRSLDRRSRLRASIAGSAGNLIEWYDFYAYAYTALYFAASFFPSGDRTAQLINVAAIYAAGFLVRPIGAWYFGRFADRRGRRAALVTSVLLMGAGSLLIAILPGYEVIGVAAPVLLLIARLMQGFSSGGQYGAAASYLSEVAESGKRGFFASFQFVTLIGGQLSALLILGLLQWLLGEVALREGAWRIPFAIGAIAAISILLFKDQMHETVSRQTSDAGSLRALARHPRAMFTVMTLSAAGALALYSFTTYMQKYLVNTAGLDAPAASKVMIVATLGFMLLQPIIGTVSDRIGRRTCLLLFTGGMTIAAVPLFSALEGASDPYQAFALIACALFILSFYTSVSGLFKAELFPTEVRALGVGLGHAIASALFGGTAEFVALQLKQAGAEWVFGWYLALVCGAAFVVSLRMREPRAAGHIDGA